MTLKYKPGLLKTQSGSMVLVLKFFLSLLLTLPLLGSSASYAGPHQRGACPSEPDLQKPERPLQKNPLPGQVESNARSLPHGRTGFSPVARLRTGSINFQKLGLSPEQKQQFRDLRSKNAPRARQLKAALREKRRQMKQLMFNPDASKAQIKAAHRQLRQMQDQMEEMQIDDFISMRSLLTAEQLRHLPELRTAATGHYGGARSDKAPAVH